MPRKPKEPELLPLIPLPERDEVRFTGNLFDGLRGQDDGIERHPLDMFDLYEDVMRYHDDQDAKKAAAAAKQDPLDIEGTFRDPWSGEVYFTGNMWNPDVKGELEDQPPLRVSDFTYEERLQKRNRTLDT